MVDRVRKDKSKYCSRCSERIYPSPETAAWIRMTLCWQLICERCDQEKRYD